jgi:hypothetical protein
MKKIILFSLAAGIILALAVVLATPGAAKASRITTCALQTNTEEIPGKVWFTEDGTVLHIRGQIAYGKLEPLAGHPECDPAYSSGKIKMEVNINLNLVTGEGNAYGKNTITADGVDASWIGTFSGKITGGAYTGLSVSQGTGEWDGLLQKVKIFQTGETTYETYGYVLIP